MILLGKNWEDTSKTEDRWLKFRQGWEIFFTTLQSSQLFHLGDSFSVILPGRNSSRGILKGKPAFLAQALRLICFFNRIYKVFTLRFKFFSVQFWTSAVKSSLKILPPYCDSIPFLICHHFFGMLTGEGTNLTAGEIIHTHKGQVSSTTYLIASCYLACIAVVGTSLNVVVIFIILSDNKVIIKINFQYSQIIHARKCIIHNANIWVHFCERVAHQSKSLLFNPLQGLSRWL